MTKEERNIFEKEIERENREHLINQCIEDIKEDLKYLEENKESYDRVHCWQIAL